jgi:hypothetical protein
MEVGTCVTPFQNTSCVQCTKKGEWVLAERVSFHCAWYSGTGTTSSDV